MTNKKRIIICTIIVALVLTLNLFAFVGCEGGTGIFAPRSVKITLNVNGGSGVAQLTIIGKPGDPMQLPSPTREGFTFDKWYDGFDLIDNTVFPSKDMTLTARYYCKEEYAESIVWESDFNEELGGSSGYYYVGKTDKNKDQVEYLLSNPHMPITVVAELDAYCSAAPIAQSFGAEAYLILTGSNRKDTLKKVTVKNYNGYQKYTLSAQTTSAVLIGSDLSLLNLLYDTNMGSTYCYFRNLNISITYTVAVGTLV